jgi:hypothetical protein
MESGNDIFRANFLEFCEAIDYYAKERGLLHWDWGCHGVA